MGYTVVAGASDDPSKYSYRAVQRLIAAGEKVTALGIKNGKIGDTEILADRPALESVDTVTLYISPKHQDAWMDYLLSLNPKRIIFNPGTENPVFAEKAQKQGIELLEACTLTMLSVGNYR